MLPFNKPELPPVTYDCGISSIDDETCSKVLESGWLVIGLITELDAAMLVPSEVDVIT